MSTYSRSSISPEAFGCQSSDSLRRKLSVFMCLLRPSATFRWGKEKKKKKRKKKKVEGEEAQALPFVCNSTACGRKFTQLLRKGFSHKNAIPVTPLPHNFHTAGLLAKEHKVTPGSLTHAQRVSLSDNAPRCTSSSLGTTA